MPGVLVDSNVILDVLSDDPEWADWSESALHRYHGSHELFINPVIYAEVSIGFDRIEDLESAVICADLQLREIPREGLFLAGRAFLAYRSRKGSRTSPLPDFFIGAHAAVSGFELLTRDVGRYQTYFPSVPVISPSTA